MTAGATATAAARHGLFFAVYPDAATAEQLAALGRQLREHHKLAGRAFPPERLHITLHHLGNHATLEPGLVTAARRAADSVRAAPFALTLDRVASFAHKPRNRPLVAHPQADAGLDGLLALQQALGEALRREGLARWVHERYTPHLTLLYDDAAVQLRPIELVRFRVERFALMLSHLGKSRHEALASWPLSG